MKKKGNNKTVIEKLLEFRKKRNWKQFHTPKNLAISVSIEAAELMSIFQWTRDDELKERSREKYEDIKDEIADIYIYLSLLAHDLGIDLEKAALEKIKLNGKRYPVLKAEGNAKKYTEL